MEFLRFGSSIPGSYWGCCACCIIQNFKFMPSDKASIQMSNGDAGTPVMRNGGSVFAGPTYEDIFWQRLRVGTFETRDMPNHAFLAILTDSQINGGIGKAWMKILRKAGFEFVRAVGNSVYSGNSVIDNLSSSSSNQHRANYIFGLFRNIGGGALIDTFAPPAGWNELEQVVPNPPTPEDSKALQQEIFTAQRKIWDDIGPAKFLTEAEVVAAGAPVILAGKRSKYPQQEKSYRENLEKRDKSAKPAPNAFPQKEAAQPCPTATTEAGKA